MAASGGGEVVVAGLSKRYPAPRSLRTLFRPKGPPREALEGVSFDIRPGEVVGLIGANGAGKSTLLRILSGVLLPSSGTARIGGLDVVADRPRSRAQVGSALSDDRGLSPRLTVRQNLRFFGALYGLFGSGLEHRLTALADWLEATALLDREVRTLSTGERARVVLARALLHRPRALLLDELTRSLDPGAQVRLRAQVARLAREEEMAVLFASHDLAEVQSLSERVLLLDGGRVAAWGPYETVRPKADALFSRPTPSGEGAAP